jgi:Raf kinase inhibitor-like YbhB/YbcL family protein
MLLTFSFVVAMIVQTNMSLSSPDFKNRGDIPSRFTCEGEEINPALAITDLPPGTKSLALIVEDPDAPGRTFDHWIVWNIPPQEMIKQNSVPGVQGKNSAGQSKYKGPCPPSGKHRYFFKLFALDVKLNLPEGSDKKMLQEAMKDHTLGKVEIVGLYQKKNSHKE